MATPLSRLHALVPPPANPFYSSGDWSLVEQELGLRLPDDYKQLIESYGQGMFQGRRKYSGLNITSFLCPVSPVMLAEATTAALRSLELEYRVYPQMPGLLGFGVYKDVDFLAWHVDGPAIHWNIIFQDVETGTNEIPNMGLIDLVISILEGTSPLHTRGIIGAEEMEGPHSFTPEDA
ncbi:hypothetical protein ACYFX5_05290 [Bremerella sp. T1]|uniref:SMI1/KNR4 family protein n=1 Tax=Bremerella sp. TYQ1 TaxID=3119568 RepID=UPI001CCC2050|nr:SMI1/KNR4 family protein [Bremerella volcania]UBM37673.1 SMI1/KNR4 family protein [Bremerella volcania]